MSDGLARRLADLEGAETATVLASGRAATIGIMAALLRAGDHLIASRWLRPETAQCFAEALPARGVQVTFVDPGETRAWRRAVHPTTRALYVETPVLGTTRLVDLRTPRALATELGVALIVDSSAVSPRDFRPLTHGADLVVREAGLLLAPAAAGGIVAGAAPVVDEIAARSRAGVDRPDAAALRAIEEALATLDVRVDRLRRHAAAVAAWGLACEAVTAVHWAGLTSHPDHALAAALVGGGGPSVVFELADPAMAQRVGALAAAATTGAGSTRLVAGAMNSQVCIQVGLEDEATVIARLAGWMTPAIAGAS